MKKIILSNTLLILLITVFSCSAAEKAANKHNNEVYFIPTLHKYHKINQYYNYDSVRSIVQQINPDIIAVEIRNIDINEDSVNLLKIYPYEFVMMKKCFPTKTIVGFDWWEKEVENIKATDLAEDYFSKVPKRKQMKLLEKDSLNRMKMMVCMEFQKKREPIIRNSSLKQILESNDGELVKQYYQCIHEQLQGTPYSSIAEFDEQRDKMILENINQIITNNVGKRIVILTGDDHFQMLRDQFKNKQPY